MSNSETIRFEEIASITHISGAEPAGIVLRMATTAGKQITVMFPKNLVVGARDMLNTALEEHLPPYHGAIAGILSVKEVEPGYYYVEMKMKGGSLSTAARMQIAELEALKAALAKRRH